MSPSLVLRLAGLILAGCSLAACGSSDPRFAGGRTEYIGGMNGRVTNAAIQRSRPQDTVSFWDGDGVPGNPHVEVRLSEQRAYFYKGDQLVGVSQVSTGREGYNTPTGNFKVLQKDKEHRSSLYGDYVDAQQQVVKANVEVGKDPKPPGTVFLGSSMPFFMRVSNGVGLHAGYLPGVPASHGCIRMPEFMAENFFYNIPLGRRFRLAAELVMADAPLEVSVQEAQRMIAGRGAGLRVIDVRDPDEYQLCRLPGAELIPLATLPTDAATKLSDKDAELLVYCHHGMRSLQAVRHLRDLGYTAASSMAGGIEKWATEIDSTTPRY